MEEHFTNLFHTSIELKPSPNTLYEISLGTSTLLPLPKCIPHICLLYVAWLHEVFRAWFQVWDPSIHGNSTRLYHVSKLGHRHCTGGPGVWRVCGTSPEGNKPQTMCSCSLWKDAELNIRWNGRLKESLKLKRIQNTVWYQRNSKAVFLKKKICEDHILPNKPHSKNIKIPKDPQYISGSMTSLWWRKVPCPRSIQS